MMNISDVHVNGRPLSAVAIFKSETHNVIALQMEAGQVMKEHITPVTACLICVSGEVEYMEQEGCELRLAKGDYVEIPANLKHKLNAIEDSELILVR